MSSIGKFQAAIASASNETTLALANLNIDFSIIKIEAPPEFRDLGSALSSKRKSAAEHGMSHSTARKLGSLFEQAIPPTPRLFKAYGLRSSEIAKSYAVNPKGRKSLGPFAEHTGVDATSIWAAATSGTSAIAVHLLACMLARIWSASEAVGIWEQIISARRKELLNLGEAGSIHLQSLAAAQLSLSREQLAEWDASARSWLRAADAVKALRQKQVNLIVENLNIAVNRDMDVYASVIQAWSTAMVTMDKLIGGMGHSVHEGSVLLGLSSWHLYPDIVVLGNSTSETKQGDPLVGPGGIVTIGLQSLDSHNDRGVYWSLPLAHVRYYGDPIEAEGSLRLDSSRVSLEQLLLVATGSLIATWSSLSTNLNESLKLLSLMWGCCELEVMATPDLVEKKRLGETSWLRILADSAELFLRAGANEQQNLKRLITLGQRRATFFGQFSFPTTVFGITGEIVQRLLKDNESRISFLRRLAAKSKAEVDSLVIRVRVETQDLKYHYELVTALPQLTSKPGEKPEYRFIHWTPSHTQRSKSPTTNANKLEYKVELAGYEQDAITPHESLDGFNWKSPPNFFRNVPTVDTNNADQNERPRKGSSHWKFPARSPRLN